MNLNLDALDGLDDFDRIGQSGRPLMLPLDRVHEDPNQPRKQFDDTKQLELTASVAEGGVRVPVSVRTHPEIPGQYVLNFGARRRRAALSAGLSEIPVLIDERFDDFDQVIENVQRADLTPMEMALFIKDKLVGGLKAAKIAQRLGMSRSAIAKFAALIDAPPEIEAVYTSGRSTSPDTLYELRTLFNHFPNETRSWLCGGREVSRRSVDELRRDLTGTVAAVEVENEVRPKRQARVTMPNLINRPVLAIKVGARLGIIALTRRPPRDDLVIVKWDDTAEFEEVPVGDIRVIRLDEARRFEPLNRGIGTTKPKPPPE